MAVLNDPSASEIHRDAATNFVVPHCCERMGGPGPFASTACPLLEKLMRGEFGTLWRSVDQNWGPTCYERVRSGVILQTISRETDPSHRSELIVLLRGYPIDGAIAQVVFEAHANPLTRAFANQVLADFGEDHLVGFMPLLAAPSSRRDALEAIMLVLDAPLDSPSLLRAAKELRSDPDQEVSTFAQIVVNRFERFAAMSPDEAFVTATSTMDVDRVRRLLKRRRALCTSNAARVRAAEVLAPAEIAARDQMCATAR